MLAITGFSRNGKGALVAGAFDERIAVVDPGNAGCGGTAIECFISPSLHPDYYIYTAGLHAVGVAYSISDPSIATIGADGLVTAISAGTVTIEATFKGLTAQCTLTIE